MTISIYHSTVRNLLQKVVTMKKFVELCGGLFPFRTSAEMDTETPRKFIQVGGSLTTAEDLQIRQGRSFQTIPGDLRQEAELS